MNNKRALVVSLFFSLILFSSTAIFAQNDTEEVRLNIQLRPRAEYRNGVFTPILEGQKPAAFAVQRSRIGLTYLKSPYLKIGISTQIVSVWGNDPQVQTTANDISLYEAWAQLYFNSKWSFKVGRQVFSYDDERILGALDWNSAGRKHDAVLLTFSKKKFTANTAFAFNQNAEKITSTYFDKTFSQPYKAMEFLWMKYAFSSSLSVSAIALNLATQNNIDSSIANLQTIGSNLYYNKNRWSIMGTYYFQTGRTPLQNAPSIKTNAWMASVKAVYDVNRNTGFSVGSDYLSGRDMNATSSKITYFNPLYGTGHKFYGAMDYFFVASAHNNVGLWDSYLNLNLNNSEKLNWQVALHHFEAASQVINYSGGKAKSALGNEVDVTVNFKVTKDVKLSGGYSQMLTSPSMKYIKNIAANQNMKSLQNWIWLSLNINPDILIYKSK
ncbi:alginate export family protein [Arachidicoccus sp.]|uniref:alginate export family protein n=1 Tax=Arachidicoccus sp. TaxID=1872624 RepID=UPI003D200670